MTLEQLLKSVGSRIAELRGKCNLTQKNLSAKSGITYRYLQTIESGRANVTLGTLHRLASYLHVKVPELLHPSHSTGHSSGHSSGHSAGYSSGPNPESQTPEASEATEELKAPAEDKS